MDIAMVGLTPLDMSGPKHLSRRRRPVLVCPIVGQQAKVMYKQQPHGDIVIVLDVTEGRSTWGHKL